LLRMTRRRTVATGIAVAGCAAATLTMMSAPAQAAGIVVKYDAAGTTHIAKTNSDLSLGPSTLTVALQPTGVFTAKLPLPTTTTTFKAFGLLPTTADVTFIPVGKVRGRLSFSDNTTVTSTVQYTVQLSNGRIGGTPAYFGQECKTVAPVTITAATPAGQSFDISNGGPLTGTYTIGKFQHCEAYTGLINTLVPGAGNTVTFDLSAGRIVSG
jgi:hypothetical protein